MLELARSPAPADRDRLLLALVDLCDQGGCEEPRTATLVRDVFMGLIGRVEHDIRGRLAWKLAAAAWAPRELILTLAQDDIEIARPIIAASPVLQDMDLIRLLIDTDAEHQIEVARRPGLGPEVIDAILDQGAPDVLATLAANTSAQMSAEAMKRLVSHAQDIAALRAPLSRHPHLTLDLGAVLYAWVGEVLRRALADRFSVDEAAFQAMVDQVVREARPSGDEGSRQVEERAAMDRRVVQKLKAGDRLRPGLLMRALRDGKLSLFRAALAEMGGFTPEEVHRALSANSSEMLVLACAAVGVDRSVTPSLLALVRPLNDGRPGAKTDGSGGTTLLDPASAARTFRRRLAGV